MGQKLTDNVYINIHVFPVSPLKAKISKNQKRFASVHVILATNTLFTFIYELMGHDLTDNVFINIQVFPLPPLKSMISKKQ